MAKITSAATSTIIGAGSNDNALVVDQSGGFNGGQLGGMRNLIINGAFNINQRAYVSGAAVGAALYAHDRWKMAASADTYTFSTTANKTTVTIPAGKVLQQVVEGLNLQTGTYVLSWEGTAQGKIGAGAYGNTGLTNTITGGTNTTIEFGPGTVSNVQLEWGTRATPFERRFVGLELQLCQRYLPVSTPANNYAGLAASAVLGYASIPFLVTPRVAPDGITFAGGTPISFTNGTGVPVAVSSLTFVLAGMNSVLLAAQVASGLTIGQAGFLSHTTNPLLFTGCEL